MTEMNPAAAHPEDESRRHRVFLKMTIVLATLTLCCRFVGQFDGRIVASLSRQRGWKIAVATVAAMLLSLDVALADPKEYLNRPANWFSGEQAKEIAKNILSFQSELGGWPKNVNTTASLYTGPTADLKPIFDNGATTDELRFLARIYNATNDETYRSAFDRGLNYVLRAQYDNGGWPQSHPPGRGYSRHITFNDDAMIRLMRFVREVASTNDYAFVDDAHRTSCSTAFKHGIACILKCQIRTHDKLTAWCAQHDEVDYRPRPARTYELATLSGSESVGITRLLMELDDPPQDVITAVDAAVKWFETAALNGIRMVVEKDVNGPKGTNKVIVSDPNAPRLWARFYDIETNKPIFVDRDGVPRSALADIGYERRNGYSWYGTWPQRLLEIEYPEWKKRVTAGTGR